MVRADVDVEVVADQQLGGERVVAGGALQDAQVVGVALEQVRGSRRRGRG
jgi:hypothetical protein